MAITIREVAAQAGVSVSTVSRVFSAPNRLSEKTVRRVREIALELNYVPNPVARALITGRSKNLGLVVPDVANPFVTALLKTIQTHARQLGYAVFIANTDEDAGVERELCQQLAFQSHGLIMFAPRMSSAHIRQIATQNRVVIINRPLTDLPCVLIDSAPGTRATVDHLAGLGHHRIAYLPGPARSWANRGRSRAVAGRAAELGLSLVQLGATSARHEQGIAAADEVVRAGVTGVIAFDDLLAFGLIEGLYRHGKSVPEDVSVTGHDDILASIARPPLTTVSGNGRDAGRVAVDILVEANRKVGDIGSTLRLPTELVVRESTGQASS